MKINEYNVDQKKKILCLPGVLMNGECFAEIAANLPEYHFICITYDAFHYGPDEFESLEQQCGKITDILTQMGYQEFELAIGTSLGTIFACHLAAQKKLTIHHVWLDGGVNLYKSGHPKILSFLIYHIFHQITAKARKGEPAKFLGRDMPEAWLIRTEEPRKALTDYSLKQVTHVLVHYHIEPGISCPISMTFGEKEDNIQKNADAVRALYPNTSVSVEKGCNHLEYMDNHTEEYAMRLRQFIQM